MITALAPQCRIRFRGYFLPKSRTPRSCSTSSIVWFTKSIFLFDFLRIASAGNDSASVYRSAVNLAVKLNSTLCE